MSWLPNPRHVHLHLPLVPEPQKENLFPRSQKQPSLLTVLVGESGMSGGAEARNEVGPRFILERDWPIGTYHASRVLNGAG